MHKLVKDLAYHVVGKYKNNKAKITENSGV